MSTQTPDSQKTEEQEAFEQAYDRYLKDLDDGSLFRFAAANRLGRTGMGGTGWIKQLDTETGKLLLLMGNMVMQRRSLLAVALCVVRSTNPNASRDEWESKLFSSAWEVLCGQYDDVEKRSGPESYRHSECVSPYTRDEKLIVLETLNSICYGHIGVGWAADRAAKELGVRGIIERLTGK